MVIVSSNEPSASGVVGGWRSLSKFGTGQQDSVELVVIAIDANNNKIP